MLKAMNHGRSGSPPIAKRRIGASGSCGGISRCGQPAALPVAALPPPRSILVCDRASWLAGGEHHTEGYQAARGKAREKHHGWNLTSRPVLSGCPHNDRTKWVPSGSTSQCLVCDIAVDYSDEMSEENIARYRSLADECRLKAENAINPIDKEAWSRLAWDWTKMAHTAEARRDQV